MNTWTTTRTQAEGEQATLGRQVAHGSKIAAGRAIVKASVSVNESAYHKHSW